MSRRRRGLLVAAVSGIVLVVGVAGVLLSTPRSSGQRLDLTMPALDGGGRVSLASYRGRPVVLNFFASWCTFCIAEMPAFGKVNTALGGRVAFVGVAMQDRAAAAQKLAEITGVTYDLADDRSGRVFERLGGRGMPTTVFIDAEGRVVETFTGPLSERALRNRIAKHFSV